MLHNEWLAPRAFQTLFQKTVSIMGKKRATQPQGAKTTEASSSKAAAVVGSGGFIGFGAFSESSTSSTSSATKTAAAVTSAHIDKLSYAMSVAFRCVAAVGAAFPRLFSGFARSQAAVEEGLDHQDPCAARGSALVCARVRRLCGVPHRPRSSTPSFARSMTRSWATWWARGPASTCA